MVCRRNTLRYSALQSARRSASRSQHKQWHCPVGAPQIRFGVYRCRAAISALKAATGERAVMQVGSRKLLTMACAAMTGVSITALTVSEPAAQYKMTVNKERLHNAANEPQNWLMMNGDYGSNRYSKLTQINRDNVKTMRLVWALALGG